MKSTLRVLVSAVVLAVALSCTVYAEEASSESAEQPADLGKVLAQQDLRARLEFAEGVGFTPEQLKTIFVTKHRIHKLQDDLRLSLTELAAALTSEGEDAEFKRQAADKYLAVKAEFDSEYAEVQEKLISDVGADDDPLKMAALMIVGAVDNGRRVTCAVQSAVSGGASPGVHGQSRENKLGRSFGPPPLRPGSKRSLPRFRSKRTRGEQYTQRLK